MEKTYLDRIKEAEEKAGDILRTAINRTEQMLYDAEKENAEYEKKQIEGIDKQYKALLEKAESDAVKLVEEADVEYALQSDVLKSAAIPNINDAVKLVVEKVTNGSC